MCWELFWATLSFNKISGSGAGSVSDAIKLNAALTNLEFRL